MRRFCRKTSNWRSKRVRDFSKSLPSSSMHNLGQTRSSRKADHLLQTPDTFVRAPLPGMDRATAIVHAGPALGAAFTQYTAEIEAGGRLGDCRTQRFLYVLD